MKMVGVKSLDDCHRDKNRFPFAVLFSLPEWALPFDSVSFNAARMPESRAEYGSCLAVCK
jgi:hypothetical protein